METREKTVTTINKTVILTKEEVIALLINAKIIPKNVIDITIESDASILYIYTEETAEQEMVITNEMQVLLKKNVMGLPNPKNENEDLLSIAAQNTLRRHGFKTLQDCVEFTKEGLLKKKYFPVKVVLELEELLNELGIPF